MAFTAVDKGETYFNTVLYTGNDTARSITTGLVSTDFIWNKRRDSTGSHLLYDRNRGINIDLNTHNQEADETQVGTVTAFGTNTFSLGTHGGTNASGESKVSWCWAAGGAASSNGNGTITSNVSVNTTSGFSIVTYTGNGTTNATIGHGLSGTPAWILLKNRDDSENWWNYHVGLSDPSTKAILMNSTNGEFTPGTSAWYPTNFSSSVFSVLTDNASNSSGDDYVAYCWKEVKGFSKFGSFTGNGDSDGPFVYCGFKPAWVLTKKISEGSGEWHIYDNKRVTLNPNNNVLSPNANYADSINANVNTDFLSNGFKIRNDNDNRNDDGETHMFCAFAEHPFVSSTGTPVTAKLT